MQREVFSIITYYALVAFSIFSQLLYDTTILNLRIISLLKMILLFFLISSPLFLSWSLRTGEAKIISGSVQKNTEWTYFTKFCFENNGGEISFELIFPDTQCEPNRVNGSHCLSLVFYYDEDEVFRKLYEGSAKNLPCEDKIRPPYLGLLSVVFFFIDSYAISIHVTFLRNRQKGTPPQQQVWK